MGTLIRLLSVKSPNYKRMVASGCHVSGCRDYRLARQALNHSSFLHFVSIALGCCYNRTLYIQLCYSCVMHNVIYICYSWVMHNVIHILWFTRKKRLIKGMKQNGYRSSCFKCFMRVCVSAFHYTLLETITIKSPERSTPNMAKDPCC